MTKRYVKVELENLADYLAKHPGAKVVGLNIPRERRDKHVRNQSQYNPVSVNSDVGYVFGR